MRRRFPKPVIEEYSSRSRMKLPETADPTEPLFVVDFRRFYDRAIVLNAMRWALTSHKAVATDCQAAFVASDNTEMACTVDHNRVRCMPDPNWDGLKLFGLVLPAHRHGELDQRHVVGVLSTFQPDALTMRDGVQGIQDIPAGMYTTALAVSELIASRVVQTA